MSSAETFFSDVTINLRMLCAISQNAQDFDKYKQRVRSNIRFASISFSENPLRISAMWVKFFMLNYPTNENYTVFSLGREYGMKRSKAEIFFVERKF